jgi:hypothetical protein
MIIGSCSGAELTYSDDVSGLTECNGTGIIQRTFTATDSCGNINTCTQQITVLDTTKPSITCPCKRYRVCSSELYNRYKFNCNG